MAILPYRKVPFTSPTLYKLEDKGYISSYKKQVGKRLKRIYYHIEDIGTEHLNALVTEYYALNKFPETVLNQLTISLDSYIIQNPSFTYDDLVLHFGSPSEIVSSYYIKAETI